MLRRILVAREQRQHTSIPVPPVHKGNEMERALRGWVSGSCLNLADVPDTRPTSFNPARMR
jgi:hypothetical protein